MSDSLLPCPFCGDKGARAFSTQDDGFMVECGACTALVDRMDSIEEASERWNRRALADTQPAPSLKERPEPALTDEQIVAWCQPEALQVYSVDDIPSAWENVIRRAHAAGRAALSHRSTEEPADPEGARDRHVAAAAALLGPGYALKGG